MVNRIVSGLFETFRVYMGCDLVFLFDNRRVVMFVRIVLVAKTMHTNEIVEVYLSSSSSIRFSYIFGLYFARFQAGTLSFEIISKINFSSPHDCVIGKFGFLL